jgi:hypothetical protein
MWKSLFDRRNAARNVLGTIFIVLALAALRTGASLMPIEQFAVVTAILAFWALLSVGLEVFIGRSVNRTRLSRVILNHCGLALLMSVILVVLNQALP